MTDSERAAAAAKGDAVPLFPLTPTGGAVSDNLLTYRDVAHALTDAVVDCPLSYHDGRPVGDRATDRDVIPWLRRLAKISEVVASIDARDPAAADNLAQLRALRDGLARLHEDAKRWLTESDDRPNLRAAERRIAKLLAACASADGAPGGEPSPGRDAVTVDAVSQLNNGTRRLLNQLLDAHERHLATVLGLPPGAMSMSAMIASVADLRARIATGEPPETPHPHDVTCSRCRARLVFSARQRGDGLCGPCHRKATGTDGLADRCRDAGIEPSLVLEILASPEGRAAIAECMSRPPVRQPDGAWREPRQADAVRERSKP